MQDPGVPGLVPVPSCVGSAPESSNKCNCVQGCLWTQAAAYLLIDRAVSLLSYLLALRLPSTGVYKLVGRFQVGS